MPQTNHDLHLLAQAFCETAAGFAFLFPDPANEPPAIPNEPFLAGQIEFKGPFDGRLLLTAPESVCREVAANVMAIELSEVEPHATEDALKELCNNVASEFMLLAGSEESEYDLLIPCVQPVEASKVANLVRDGNNAVFLVEDAPVVLQIERLA